MSNSRTTRAAAAGTAHDLVDLHRSLLETAFQLSREHQALPAGSVLRCFSRAVHRARLQGIDAARLPAEARRIAEASLVERAARAQRAGRQRGTVLAASA